MDYFREQIYRQFIVVSA